MSVKDADGIKIIIIIGKTYTPGGDNNKGAKYRTGIASRPVLLLIIAVVGHYLRESCSTRSTCDAFSQMNDDGHEQDCSAGFRVHGGEKAKRRTLGSRKTTENYFAW